MTFDEIFEAYYTLFRVEDEIPDSTDPEYTVGMRLANEAVNRWSNYDNTYWKELFTSLVLADEGQTITTGEVLYDCPDDFLEAGGFVKILDSDNNTLRSYPIIEPHEAQFKTDSSFYCFFTGNPADGYTLHLNPSPDAAINGMTIDYVYYKQPTLFTAGGDITEMKNPYFIVHRMLANAFRGARNPYRNSAMVDAEDALKIMKMENESGTWANPWQLQDNSGSTFGA